MPRINRRAFKAAAKKQGLTGKKMRKSFNAETRKLNGGKSKAGRLWRGGIKMAAGMVPGIGGALAGVLTDTVQEKGLDPSELPMFQKDAPQAAQTSLGEAMVKQADETGMSVGAKPQTVAGQNIPPAFEKTNLSKPAPSLAESADNVANGGSASGSDNEDEAPTRSGKSFAPSKTGKDVPAKKDNKIIYIVVGSLFLLLVIFLIVKATSAKKQA